MRMTLHINDPFTASHDSATLTLTFPIFPQAMVEYDHKEIEKIDESGRRKHEVNLNPNPDSHEPTHTFISISPDQFNIPLYTPHFYLQP